jgi:hypothetical protein
LIAAGLGHSVLAGPLEDARSALALGDYSTALPILQNLSDQGNAEARYDLGAMYWNGRGVTQDYKEAVGLIRQSANQGYAPAEYDLGISYRDGLGNSRDDAEAARWNRKAAEHGFAPAQHNVGAQLMSGRGVPKNETQAVQWFRKAADQGWVNSLGALGIAYADGRGVAPDPVEAYKWLSLAVEGMRGGPDRDKVLGALDQLAAGMTPAQLDQAKQLAQAWKPTGTNDQPGFIRQHQAISVAGGQSVDAGTFTVAAPAGNGWKVETFPNTRQVRFTRSGTAMGDAADISVGQKALDSDAAVYTEQEIVATIRLDEEAGFRERYPSSTFRLSDASQDPTTIGSKKLYRSTYQVTDRITGVPVQSTSTIYIYFPADWKPARRVYVFVLEQPQKIGDQAITVDKIAVEPVIASLQEK